MARDLSVKLFFFEELSEKAKAKAIERERKFVNEDQATSSLITDGIREILNSYGLPSESVAWTLGVQGSGVAFYGNISLDGSGPAQKLIPRRLKNLNKETNVSIKIERVGSGSYTHSGTMKVTVDCDYYYLNNLPREREKEVRKDMAALETAMQDLVVEASNKAYKFADVEYDYHNSDEAIIENIKANEIEESYLEDGSIFKKTG